jgi:hypothetical protein
VGIHEIWSLLREQRASLTWPGQTSAVTLSNCLCPSDLTIPNEHLRADSMYVYIYMCIYRYTYQ